MDPVRHEDNQPIGDAMMEDALGREDVIIKTVMEYMVNFQEHIDSVVSEMRANIASLRDEVSILRDELYQRHQTNVDNQALNEDDDEDEDNNDDDDADSNKHNIDRVLQKLPLLSDQFLFIWDQGKCKKEDNITYCKDLYDVWNVYPNFNALNTLLVDDSA
ncbi:hypothetical protein F3Y22_tig00112383pilonHSYRG00389 [Hibiscus syriacus]|uniref:Uncharacterized protein n=1 Tax=Hibiscus syriacus TaxID=106335 RepID=A0A6A2XDL3_HIBSY|nr:hypothetical protein F3Y22_tig00112383pilonHSYRG00389 [Hibiscus syriacus]